VAPREAAVHVVVGSESFLAEEALEAILRTALGPDREAGLQVLRGDETNWARLVDNLGMGSLFAPKRAVVVRNAEALKGDGEEAVAYLEDPTPGVTLVLLAAKPDKRTKVWKRVLEKAAVTPADPPKGGALRAFALDRLRQRKLRVAEDGVVELVECFGQDLRRLVGEIDKLEAFAQGAGQATLSAEDVAAVVGRGMAQPLYKLADAFAGRRLALALELLTGLLEEGEAGLRLLATLHRALRQVKGARALRERRASRDEVARRLQIPPFKVGNVLEAAGRWSEADLSRALRALGQADRRLKLSVAADVALTAALVEACGGTRGAPPSGGLGTARPSPRPGR
jgi:DNA polymerase-3 subunit delta